MSAGYAFPAEDGEDSPWPIFERVLRFPELLLQSQLVHEHEVRFAFVMRLDHGETGWMRGQKMMLGDACMPRVTGSLAGLFDQLLEDTIGYRPDFLIRINAEWWDQASDREREILIFHEVKHCGQAVDRYGAPRFTRETNAPVLAMVSHDLEEFNDVVARYGAWKSDIVDFIGAVDRGPPPPANDGRHDVGDIVREALAGMDLERATPDEVIARLDVEIAKLTDGELPPDVDNVDPELKRGEPSQAESTEDVF